MSAPGWSLAAPVDLSGSWDVVVVGAGNAALCAAMTAREQGARVLVLERASFAMRGGNTRHTRNVRVVHDWSDAFSEGTYGYDELWSDLCSVGTGPSNEALASLTVRRSAELPHWMTTHGIHWQTALAGTLHLNRTNRFFLGGGKALLNAYFRTVESLGIDVSYDSFVRELAFDGDRCTKLVVEQHGRAIEVTASVIVCACGGFEANLEWLREYWGDAVDNYVIRGPIDNDGTVLRALYEHGAMSAGEPRQFHSVAVDARSPRYDGGIATRLDSIPFGITLNRDLVRFYDEGQDFWPKRYAIWGRNIAEQPDQLAYSLWDAKVAGRFLPPMYEPVQSNTLEGVASGLGVDEARLVAAVNEFNAAVVPGATFDPSILDDCHTEGLVPPKSHWAQPLDTAPFFGVALRPGITFTYMGVAVDDEARVIRSDGSLFSNVFAAGEIMSGNVLSSGYLAGFGMTIGAVWGRIAGMGAARVALG